MRGGRGNRPALAATRRSEIASMLQLAGSVTVAELEQRFGISSMTARRDLADLERQGQARRTHGGAVLPSITTHEDSFSSRLSRDSAAKDALAEAALTQLAPHESVFLDSSTTSYHVARQLASLRMPLTVITNSLPVMELIAGGASEQVELIGVGGMLRRLTSSYVGPLAVQAVSAHFADRLFFSVKGLTHDGVLTDADALEAEVKRAMIEHADKRTLLMDESKLASRGLSVISSLDQLTSVIVHGVPNDELSVVRARGVEVVVAPNGAGPEPEKG